VPALVAITCWAPRTSVDQVVLGGLKGTLQRLDRTPRRMVERVREAFTIARVLEDDHRHRA